MSNPSKRIAGQLPLHYSEYYPSFILFMQKYYEWLYRKSGFSQDEVTSLRSDTSWLSTDPDAYVNTGLLKYIDESVDKSIIQLGDIRNPGASADLIADTILLEEIFEGFTTADDQFFVTSDSVSFETPRISQEMINSWFSSMGSTPVMNDKYANNVVDQVLLISLLKHIYAIKGTEKSIQLFFNVFFNVDVQIYQPKFDIAIIDGGWVPDSHGHVRDDYYYNEYSYVIRAPGDTTQYMDLFDSLYLKNIHPAGFKVFLEKLPS